MAECDLVCNLVIGPLRRPRIAAKKGNTEDTTYSSLLAP
jgi:hypothetical protein